MNIYKPSVSMRHAKNVILRFSIVILGKIKNQSNLTKWYQ